MKLHTCLKCGDRFEWPSTLGRCDQPLTDETRPGSKIQARREGDGVALTATLRDGSRVELCSGKFSVEDAAKE